MIKLSFDDFFSLLNIINEVCHGINVRNFKETIGDERKTVVDFLDKISNKDQNNEIIICVSDFEQQFLKKSFERVLREIEEWEFQTRIGVDRSEARAIMEKIVKA